MIDWRWPFLFVVGVVELIWIIIGLAGGCAGMAIKLNSHDYVVNVGRCQIQLIKRD